MTLLTVGQQLLGGGATRSIITTALDNRQEAERRLAEAAETLGARYALTGCSGAERIAPHISYHRVTAYVESKQIKQVARHAGFREVSRGANVQIFDAYDDGVFHGKEEDRGNMDSPPCSALH